MDMPIADSAVQKYYVVRQADLPISCPRPGMSQWDSHPKVYLALKPNIRYSCPYCGEVYKLVDD